MNINRGTSTKQHRFQRLGLPTISPGQTSSALLIEQHLIPVQNMG
jgi:hypothetical protein